MTTAIAVTRVGSRQMCRYGAAFGRLVARERLVTCLAVAGIALNVVLFVVMTMLSAAAHRDQVPLIFTPPPAYFCPAGQHVTGVDTAGWPVCARDH